MTSPTGAQRQALLPVTHLILAVLILAIGFHALGRFEEIAIDWSSPLQWLSNASPETALAATLRTAGLAGCYWVLITALLYWLSRRRGTTPRWVRLVTLPTVRRIVDRAFAAALTASMAFSPVSQAAAEEEPIPIVFEVHDGVPIPHLLLGPGDTAPAVEQPSPLLRPSPPTPVATPGPNPQSSVTVTTASTYTVLAGDNLWAISDQHLQSILPTTPTTAEVMTYWRRMVETNRASLRSGDPNLIFPGEIVTIPPASADR